MLSKSDDDEGHVVNGAEGGTTSFYGPLFEGTIFSFLGFERESDFIAADLAAGKANVLIATAIECVGSTYEGDEKLECTPVCGIERDEFRIAT